MIHFMFLVLVLSLVNGQADIVCPDPADFSPCTCFDLYGFGLTSFLWCLSRGLNDSRASEILTSFITTPSITPLGGVMFYNNSLTRIPDEIHLLPQLVEANFQDNNIVSVQSGAFNFVKNLGDLDLASNQISTIEPGAFQGNYGNGSYVILRNNSLTRFEAPVFQSLLEQLTKPDVPNSSFLFIDSNPINCDCHLSWLIRDNRQLLKAVLVGTCSNGTLFEDLDPNAYADCPVNLNV